ncbi:MAG TPA: SymE family type I addiction module toxin [Verrucomicrobiota bacterium]|jgi:hypothetical protein|nr:SymE family type I addiction module toxin [Verrucomicrobiota bacterium]
MTHSDTVEPQTASVRTLKIEAAGDFWRGRIQPKIRLTGRWLKQAGFPPGARVQVICVAPGVIELRATGLVNPRRQELP